MNSGCARTTISNRRNQTENDMATRTPEEIDEERRLLYVAMTRAKDELDLVAPHRFYTHQQARFGDGHVYASISRFIPSSIRNLFDCQHWGERAPGPAKAARKSGPTTDVPASLLRMTRVQKTVVQGASLRAT